MTPKSGRNIKTPKKKSSDVKDVLDTEKTHHLKPRSQRKSPRSLITSLSISQPVVNMDMSIPATHFQLYTSLPASLRGKIWRLAFPVPLPKYNISTIPRSPKPRPSYPKVTHPKLHAFHLFPYLPKDIRIGIYSLVLPPPQIHKVRLVQVRMGRETPGRPFHPNPVPNAPKKGSCAWISEVTGSNAVLNADGTPSEYSSNFNHGEGAGPPITLFICRESRAFTAGLYTSTTIYEPWRSWNAQSWGWRKVWLCSDDAIYISKREWPFLVREWEYKIRHGRIEKSAIKRVVVQMKERDSKREEWMRLEGEEAPKLEDVLEAAEKDCEEQILRTLELWNDGEGLEELSLAIDGRQPLIHTDSRTQQPNELVDPVIEDSYVAGGRKMFLDMFDRMIERIREEHPELHVPKCTVKVLVNGTRRGYAIRWDYLHGSSHSEYVWNEHND